MQPGPFTPLANMPWIRWIDRSEIPAIALGVAAFLAFVPLYDFNAMMPRLPLQGGAFPPAFALALMFLIQLTRGATRDLRQLIVADKLSIEDLGMITAGRRAALIELGIGLVVGVERVYSQVTFDETNLEVLWSPGAFAVCFSILAYTVVQVHLFAFCVRQVFGFRRIASSYQVDLMAPELNNALSNPLIRFLMVGLVAVSFGMLLYEVVPYSSLQRRLLTGGLVAGLIWVMLIGLSMMPLIILKSRIAVAKSMEITFVRRALAGDLSGIENSQFGRKLAEFTPADLMYYEDRIKNIWEWPIEAHIRRLVIFGLLPPLTWVLAAAVEVVFETLLAG